MIQPLVDSNSTQCPLCLSLQEFSTVIYAEVHTGHRDFVILSGLASIQYDACHFRPQGIVTLVPANTIEIG